MLKCGDFNSEVVEQCSSEDRLAYQVWRAVVIFTFVKYCVP